jgi:hypothetical protein
MRIVRSEEKVSREGTKVAKAWRDEIRESRFVR